MYTILSLSDSDKHFDSAIAEYTKRVPKNLHLINLKPFKADNSEIAKQKDTEIILDRIVKHAKSYDHIVLMSITSKDYPTEDRVRLFPFDQKICFIIWWPHGLDEDRLLRASQWLSLLGLWKQTMVHGLAKLVLSEQLYRIWMIQQNRNYHY
jgi:23S rRNA (pseudouridine1915-N3)-methyltransferase